MGFQPFSRERGRVQADETNQPQTTRAPIDTTAKVTATNEDIHSKRRSAL